MFILLTIAMMIAMMVSALIMLIEENKKRKAPINRFRFGIYHKLENH